jgi:endonuclease-3
VARGRPGPQHARRGRLPAARSRPADELGRRALKPARRKETPAERRSRARRIVARLERAYPGATCALDHADALQLVVATILSAQSTDVRVNLVTPALFAKYRAAADYAAADPEVLEHEIHSTGFFRNKTKSLIGLGQALVERHAGVVPDTMDALVALPGVGRKTANVVLGTWFRKNEGVVVDTHVTRLAALLKLSKQPTPEKIERELMDVVPREKWTVFSHLLILHGRAVCVARRPKCEACVISRYCPSSRV